MKFHHLPLGAIFLVFASCLMAKCCSEITVAAKIEKLSIAKWPRGSNQEKVDVIEP